MDNYTKYYKNNYKQVNIKLKIEDYNRFVKLLGKLNLSKVDYLLYKMKEDEERG